MSQGGPESSKNSDPAPNARGQRWLALDLLRFLAVVLMVQGHTFNVVLADAVRSERWYAYHSYVHGYTAPIFLFGAGLAFGITTFRRFGDHTRLGKPVGKRLERYFWLLFIGYGLHLPNLSVSRLFDPATSDVALQSFLKVDALHNIGVTLAIAELLTVVLRSRTRLVAVVTVLLGVTVFLAPALWRFPIEQHLPHAIAGYLNANTESLFPLVPWSGFIFGGILTAHVLTLPRVIDHRVPLLGAMSAFFVLLGWGLTESGFDPFGDHNYWKTSPYFFFVRFGVVLGVLFLFGVLESALVRSHRGQGRVLSFLQLMGQESLLVYVSHLVILYGSPIHRSIDSQYARTMTLGQSSVTFVVIFAVVVAMAFVWNRFKKKRPVEFHWFRLSLAAALTLFVAVNP